MERRIDDLESHLAHQEKTIQDLSDITAEQWEVIDILKHRVDTLKERLLNLEEGSRSAAGPGDPPPPHF